MISRLRRAVTRSYTLRLIYWILVLNWIDLAAKYLPVKHKKHERKRVLLIRLDGIGDYVIWSSTFVAIGTVFPSTDYELLLVGNELWRGLAEREDIFDSRIYFDPPRAMIDPVYRFRMMRAVRRFDADIAVNPRLTREFLLMDSIARVSRARERIGSLGIANRLTKFQEWLSNRWYTRLTPSPGRDDHEIESEIKFLESIEPGLKLFPAFRGESFGDATPQDESSGVREIAVFFIGAQQADKQWPVEYFAETAAFVADRYGLEITLCGGPSDKPLVEGFRNTYARPFTDLVGRVSLSRLSELIASAKLVLTNDTGAGHIAVALACPTVVITPGNHVGRFFPYPPKLAGENVKQISVTNPLPCFGCDWTCVYTNLDVSKPKPCVADISVSSVNKAIRTILK